MGRTFGKLGLGLALALVAAQCTFKTELESLEATGGDSGADGETGGTSTGGTSTGGTSTAGTSPGGTSTSGGSGGASQGGGFIPRGGTPGLGGASGGGRARGGSGPCDGAVATGGVSGGDEGASGADDGGADDGACHPKTTGDCHFEYLGNFNRCDDGASRAQSRKYAKLVGASTIEECEAACLASPDCTAVSDYFGEPGLDRCYVMTGSCDAPRIDVASEEDAGKFYRKVCNQNGCRMDYLGNWLRCEGEFNPKAELVEGATSRADCEAQCLCRSDCTAVVDYFWLATVRGCYLFNGECCGTALEAPGETGPTYRKVCD